MKFCSKEKSYVHGGNAEDSSFWASWSREIITLMLYLERYQKSQELLMYWVPLLTFLKLLGSNVVHHL